MKYTDCLVTFREIPDEITLCINISNCQIRCKGCHSQHLWEDSGAELDEKELKKLIDFNEGITCIALMGGDPKSVNKLASWLKQSSLLRIAWYSGLQELPNEINLDHFDFIKLGPYIEELGPLDNPKTNQRFYKVTNRILEDITYRFWK